MAMRRHPGALLPPYAVDGPIETAIARARKARRRGDLRRAFLLLREAASIHEYDARVHALFGAAAVRAGRYDEGALALRHARWLRSRAGETGRADALSRLLRDMADRAAA